MYISSVKVNPSCLTLKKGSWYDYATVKVNNIDCDYCIEWYSEDPTVASVHPETGRIFGVNDGTTRIYVKSIADDYQKDYITVTVTSSAINVECIQLNKTSIRLEEGDTFELTATVCPEYATNKSINWTSSNESVATVTDGVITAKSLGTAYICAEAKDGSGEEAICSVEVTDDVLVRSITLDQSECTIAANGAVWLRETVCPEDATNKRVVWSSSNPEIVFVNPNGGLSSAQGKEGQAKIIATAEDNGGAYAECTVNVNPPIPVTGIDICATKLSLCVGEIGCVCACALPSYADNKRVRYTSSDPSVASVDGLTGYVTAKKVGTTTITATTDDGGFTKTCEVRVYIDTVTIQKDGGFNKVIFNSTGKTWYCMNCDMIFDEQNKNNFILEKRAHHNLYVNYDENAFCNTYEYQQYTDDEIKLLYAIDPYGVADYIRRYANTKPTLEETVEEKDRIFRLLFRREPKYFARNLEGVWFEVNNYEEIDDVLSESEVYFGAHVIYDWYTFFEILGVCSSILNIVFMTSFFTATTVGVVVKRIVTTGVLVASGIESLLRSEFGNYLFEEVVGAAIDDTDPEWALSYVSLYQSLDDLVDAMTLNFNYNKEIIDYCVDNTNYVVLFEMKDGTVHNLKEICDKIS